MCPQRGEPCVDTSSGNAFYRLSDYDLVMLQWPQITSWLLPTKFPCHHYLQLYSQEEATFSNLHKPVTESQMKFFRG